MITQTSDGRTYHFTPEGKARADALLTDMNAKQQAFEAAAERFELYVRGVCEPLRFDVERVRLHRDGDALLMTEHAEPE